MVQLIAPWIPNILDLQPRPKENTPMLTPVCLSARPLAVVVLATMLSATAGAVTTAGAQADTTKRATSQQRIPVQKESAGEVARRDSAARADSIRADSIARAEAARRDSIARAEAARQDSINRARQDSIARADSIAREAARRDSISRAEEAARLAAAAAVPAALARRGFYFGFAGGTSIPSGDYADPYKTGWNITVPFGWQKAASRWGVRGDIDYDSHGGKSFTQTVVPPAIEPATPTPVPPIAGAANFDVDNGSVWSGNLDVTADLVQWGANKLGALYLIGGGGVHFFDKPSFNLTPTTGTGAGVTTNYKGDSQTKFGLNGGAGVSFGIGRASLFLESRYFTAYTDNTNSDWIPVILGFKWH
jgi:hypothetical protein